MVSSPNPRKLQDTSILSYNQTGARCPNGRQHARPFLSSEPLPHTPGSQDQGGVDLELLSKDREETQ